MTDLNQFDDWAICTCDYCGMDERKCYRIDELPLNEYGEPRYYCDREDCKHMRYIFGDDNEN